jgi:hypothetical protein
VHLEEVLLGVGHGIDQRAAEGRAVARGASALDAVVVHVVAEQEQPVGLEGRHVLPRLGVVGLQADSRGSGARQESGACRPAARPNRLGRPRLASEPNSTDTEATWQTRVEEAVL